MATISDIFDQAVQCHQRGELAEAETLYREVVRMQPGFAAAHNNLGTVLVARGQTAEALESYRQALTANPLLVDAYVNLGSVLDAQGKLNLAAACYRQAIGIEPGRADAHSNLGVVLKKQGKRDEAARCYRQALVLDPAHVDAQNNLGNLFREQGKLAEAIECYQQALRVNPQHAASFNNLGVCFREMGRLDEAVTCYRQALTLNPRHADAHHNLSNALTRLGFYDEAVRHNIEALALQPGHAAALWQRACLCLLRGDLAGGWRDFEQRWAQADVVARSAQTPDWDGSRLPDKAILVYAEQGMGDTIQFCRYLPLVKDRVGRVVFECQPGLGQLCKGIAGADRVIARGGARPVHDVQAALLSLPRLLGTTLETIPATVPYVHADPELVTSWGQALQAVPGFKVGIAWQGSPVNPADRYRSMALAQLAPLTSVPGVRLISLQKGAGTDQIKESGLDILDLGDKLDAGSAFVDTAAVIKQLDLVLSVDSAVAHLAGALAAPVWVLLPLTPDWRWLLDRADSPWYPTMRLFRQKEFGDWEEVIGRVIAALTEAAKG